MLELVGFLKFYLNILNYVYMRILQQKKSRNYIFCFITINIFILVELDI